MSLVVNVPTAQVEIPMAINGFPGCILSLMEVGGLTAESLIYLLAGVFETRAADVLEAASHEGVVKYVPGEEHDMSRHEGHITGILVLALISNYFTKTLSDASVTFSARLEALNGFLSTGLNAQQKSCIVRFLSADARAIAEFCGRKPALAKLYFEELAKAKGPLIEKAANHVLRLSSKAKLTALISVINYLFLTRAPIMVLPELSREVSAAIAGMDFFMSNEGALLGLTMSDDERTKNNLTPACFPTLANVAEEVRRRTDPGFNNYQGHSSTASSKVSRYVASTLAHLESNPAVNKEILKRWDMTVEEFREMTGISASATPASGPMPIPSPW